MSQNSNKVLFQILLDEAENLRNTGVLQTDKEQKNKSFPWFTHPDTKKVTKGYMSQYVLINYIWTLHPQIEDLVKDSTVLEIHQGKQITKTGNMNYLDDDLLGSDNKYKLQRLFPDIFGYE